MAQKDVRKKYFESPSVVVVFFKQISKCIKNDIAKLFFFCLEMGYLKLRSL